MSNSISTFKSIQKSPAGMFMLALRLVAGWLYFSAFWRRLFLSNKLDPESAGYIGIKFNHFLPNALGIKPIIQYLVENPEALWWNMTIFTIIEGIVGLLFIFGLFTRITSIGVFLLALGILLGSGWLGTTCLDEWQIGVLGLAAGFTVFLSGSGKFSLDYYLASKSKFTDKKWFRWLASGELPISQKKLSRTVLIGSFAIFFMTLFTNQVFHGGLWGELHNKSVKPKLEISEVNLDKDKLSFDLFRVEGVDVYGSFLINLKLVHPEKGKQWELNSKELSELPQNTIDNRYIAKIKSGKHSLEIPLGAKARLSFENNDFKDLPKGDYQLIFTDVSGANWITELKI
jgi:thiosulfate dehydrogenase [quinone] large subunit